MSIPILMNDFCDKSVFPTNQFAISRPRGLPHLRNAGLSGAARFSGLWIAHFSGLLPQISRPESDHCNYFLDPFNRCLGNHISARISSHISCPSSRSPDCGKGGICRAQDSKVDYVTLAFGRAQGSGGDGRIPHSSVASWLIDVLLTGWRSRGPEDTARYITGGLMGYLSRPICHQR